ncbi:hypothetical protein DAPPUDRAFT_9871, partial [Daphnia pulex]
DVRWEANLKCRMCMMETADLGQNVEEIGNFNWNIICLPKNNHLNKFDSRLTWKSKQYSLDNEKILL